MSIDRRALLRGSGALAAAATLPLTRALAECITTPPQTEGPFYPVQDQVDKDADLTRVDGLTGAATGTVVHISGVVRQTSCGSPIISALVEIWQACASGRYNHPADSNSAALDENFQYWGRVRTDAAGRYAFRTVKPGAYPADATWTRPPHIHVRVIAQGLPTLTTQLYFAGEPLNASDRILAAVPSAQRDLVVVPFETDNGELRGNFDIFLSRRLGHPDGTPEME